MEKLASLEVVDTKIKELKESLASEFISEADLKKLATGCRNSEWLKLWL